MNLGSVTLLFLITISLVSSTALGHQPCRKAPARKFKRAFEEQQDSDGIVRSFGDCKTPDGYDCDICCNGVCCEKVDGFQPFRSTEQMWVPIRFIVIVGTGETTSIGMREINYQLNVLNKAWYGLGFHFFYHSFQVYKDSKMKASCNTDPCYISDNCDFYTYTMPQVKMNSEKVINVVICDVSYFGESQFPWASVEDHPHQYIEIGFQAFADRGVSAGTTYGHGKTMVHETGHYFGLLHTFERTGQCDLMGDYVDDTPSASESAQQSQACTTVLDSCPNKPGKDDFSNYMNYARDECMDHFTAGQVSRLQRATRKYRPILVSNYLVNGTCAVDELNLGNCVCNNGLSPTRFCKVAGPEYTTFAPMDGSIVVTNATKVVVVNTTASQLTTASPPNTTLAQSTNISTPAPIPQTLPQTTAPGVTYTPSPGVTYAPQTPSKTSTKDSGLSNDAIIIIAVVVSVVLLAVIVAGSIFWAQKLIKRDKKRLEKYLPKEGEAGAPAGTTDNSQAQSAPLPPPPGFEPAPRGRGRGGVMVHGRGGMMPANRGGQGMPPRAPEPVRPESFNSRAEPDQQPAEGHADTEFHAEV
jgi:hypothetical protein